MKLASSVVLLFKDPDGYSSAIVDSLHPNPNSSIQRREEPFDISLESYGTSDCKVSVDVMHFTDNSGNLKSSLMFLDNYAPPILSCVLNEVVAIIESSAPSDLLSLIVPFFSSNLKSGSTNSTLVAQHIGFETATSSAITAKLPKPSPNFPIHYEPVACLVQYVRIKNLPTTVIIGLRESGSPEIKLIEEMGNFLADTIHVSFVKEKVCWVPSDSKKNNAEPWLSLYG